MKILILPYPLNLSCKETDVVVLTERDFNHYESFFMKHPNIQPESADEIQVKCVLETQKYPLIIIRHLDWLLKKNGLLTVEICSNNDQWTGGNFQPADLIGSMLSRSFDDRLVQIKREHQGNIYRWEYIKSEGANPTEDGIDKWTFAICSNGSQNERVLNQIEQINSFKIPNCEIIICGPKPAEGLPENVRVIDDTPIYKHEEKRYPIGKKKRLIIHNATYNNLLIIHDRFIFDSNWYTKMCEYGNYFDFLMTPMYSESERETRVAGDWKIADLHIFGKLPDDRIIPYQKYDDRISINGGFILGKLDKIKKVPLEEAYYWAEAEDVIWSNQITNRNYMLQVDVNNKIYTYTYSSGLSPDTTSLLYRLRRKREYYQWQLMIKRDRATYLGVPYRVTFSYDWRMYWLYKILCTIVKKF